MLPHPLERCLSQGCIKITAEYNLSLATYTENEILHHEGNLPTTLWRQWRILRKEVENLWDNHQRQINPFCGTLWDLRLSALRNRRADNRIPLGDAEPATTVKLATDLFEGTQHLDVYLGGMVETFDVEIKDMEEGLKSDELTVQHVIEEMRKFLFDWNDLWKDYEINLNALLKKTAEFPGSKAIAMIRTSLTFIHRWTEQQMKNVSERLSFLIWELIFFM